MDQGYSVSPVIFLDTNAVHYMRLYAVKADQQGWWPKDPNERPEDAAMHVRERCRSEKNLLKGLERGLQVGIWLRRQQDEDDTLTVCMSPSTSLELIFGGLRARMFERMAKTSPPGRWWTRIKWSEEAENLEGKDLSAAVEDVVGLGEVLDRVFGVSVDYPDVEQPDEVWVMARELFRSYVCDVEDAVILAHAIVQQAQWLVTFDDDFKKGINQLREKPQRRRLKQVWRGLRPTAPSKLPGDDADENVPFELPRGISPPKIQAATAT